MTQGLSCDGLTTGYNRRAGPCVSGVSLCFHPGRFTALLGPNGCGKSTLLKAIMGFEPPWEGRALLDGAPISSLPRKSLARRVAYLAQDNPCPDYLTVGELLDLGAHAQSGFLGLGRGLARSRAEQILAETGLEGMGAAQVNRLSGGQRQRAFIAMILAQDAEILLLDEPVNHLDIRHQFGVLSLVRRLMAARGRTVIAVLHDLNLAGAFADQTILMRDGRVIAHDRTAAVLTAQRIEDVFGLSGEVLTRSGRFFFLPDLEENLSAPLKAVR